MFKQINTSQYLLYLQKQFGKTALSDTHCKYYSKTAESPVKKCDIIKHYLDSVKVCVLYAFFNSGLMLYSISLLYSWKIMYPNDLKKIWK